MDATPLAASARPPRGLTYNQLRVSLFSGGLALLAVIAAVSYVRRVETVEVVAILLFMPIFVAVVLWDWKGGLISASGAMGVYIGLRYSAIHAVGAGKFSGVILSRSLAFLAFGVIGGVANEYLKSSLRKLDLYDQVDDATGLFNARFFINDTDLEMSRSARYQSIFSVCIVDVPTAGLDALPRRRRQRVIRDMGRLLASSVRTVDRAVYAVDGDRHRLAVVLPETGAEGVAVFAGRLAARLAEFLAEQDAALASGGLASQALTFPGDEDALRQLRAEFAAVEAREHPTSPAVPSS